MLASVGGGALLAGEQRAARGPVCLLRALRAWGAGCGAGRLTRDAGARLCGGKKAVSDERAHEGGRIVAASVARSPLGEPVA